MIINNCNIYLRILFMNYNDYGEKSPISFISFAAEAKFEPPIDFVGQIRYNRKD